VRATPANRPDAAESDTPCSCAVAIKCTLKKEIVIVIKMTILEIVLLKFITLIPFLILSGILQIMIFVYYGRKRFRVKLDKLSINFRDGYDAHVSQG